MFKIFNLILFIVVIVNLSLPVGALQIERLLNPEADSRMYSGATPQNEVHMSGTQGSKSEKQEAFTVDNLLKVNEPIGQKNFSFASITYSIRPYSCLNTEFNKKAKSFVSSKRHKLSDIESCHLKRILNECGTNDPEKLIRNASLAREVLRRFKGFYPESPLNLRALEKRISRMRTKSREGYKKVKSHGNFKSSNNYSEEEQDKLISLSIQHLADRENNFRDPYALWTSELNTQFGNNRTERSIKKKCLQLKEKGLIPFVRETD